TKVRVNDVLNIDELYNRCQAPERRSRCLTGARHRRGLLMTLRSLSTLVFAIGIGATHAATQDWPQWHGPDRNGLSKETGLSQKWPTNGPPQLWSIASLGAGYGSIAVVGDRIFVQGAKDRQSVVYALNRADGAGAWSKALGRAGTNDRGSGPRG